MKKSELTKLIKESYQEVLAEGRGMPAKYLYLEDLIYSDIDKPEETKKMLIDKYGMPPDRAKSMVASYLKDRMAERVWGYFITDDIGKLKRIGEYEYMIPLSPDIIMVFSSKQVLEKYVNIYDF